MVCCLVSIHFDSPELEHTVKKLIKLWTINLEISSIWIYLEKRLGIVSPPHFVNDFLRKMFLMLYSIN